MYLLDLEAASGVHLRSEWLQHYPYQEIGSELACGDGGGLCIRSGPIEGEYKGLFRGGDWAGYPWGRGCAGGWFSGKSFSRASTTAVDINCEEIPWLANGWRGGCGER